KPVDLGWHIGHFSEQVNGAQDHLEDDPLPLLRGLGGLKEGIIKSKAKLSFPLVRLITPDFFKARNGGREANPNHIPRLNRNAVINAAQLGIEGLRDGIRSEQVVLAHILVDFSADPEPHSYTSYLIARMRPRQFIGGSGSTQGDGRTAVRKP